MEAWIDLVLLLVVLPGVILCGCYCSHKQHLRRLAVLDAAVINGTEEEVAKAFWDMVNRIG
jgi:hypothetical protein